MVLRDVTPLIVPSAEIVFSYGAKKLEHLIEEINVSWSKCDPLANSPIPQPDYSVDSSPLPLPVTGSKNSSRRLVIGRKRISWQRNGCTFHFSPAK